MDGHRRNYCGLCGRPLAVATRDPHSRSSLLVSSLLRKTSMKQRLSFSFSAADIAVIKSASVFTCRNSQPNFPVSNTQKMRRELEKSQDSKFQRTGVKLQKELIQTKNC